METHYRPENEDTYYYASEFTIPHQSPLVVDDIGTYYDSSLLAAMRTPYEMFPEEPYYFPTPGLMLGPMWSSIPEEDLPSQELLSQPSPQSALFPLTEMRHPVQKKNAARRKPLTKEERQNIRLYREDNRRVSHSEIAELFGVHRTTVTRVLRLSTKSPKPEHKCQNQPEGARITISKMQNGKTPDIDTALSIWAAKKQNGGFDIDESQIISQAQHFASACGYPDFAGKFEAQEWLETFKSNNLSGRLPNDPLCSENQNATYTTTTTNCLSMDGIAVRELVEVKEALELVHNHFQNSGLSAQERTSIDRMRDVLEERILSSGSNSQG